MSDRLKFILRIIGFTAACILLALAIYVVFFKKSVTEIINTGSTPSPSVGGMLPDSGAGEPGATPDDGTPDTGTDRLPPSRTANGGPTFTTLLTNTGIASPTATANGAVAYYNPADGKFYTIDADGNVISLSSATFPKAETVTFAPEATAAVLEFPDGSNVMYSFETAQQVTLPTHWEDFSFSTSGDELAAKSLGSDESNRGIVVTSTDGSSTRVIASLGDNADDVTINWSPNNTVLGFSATGANSGGAFGRQEIYLIGPSGDAIGALFVDGTNFRSIWAPDGTHLLYSVADPSNGYRATLWFADSRGDRGGESRKRMSLQTTVDKCTFADATTVYCGVPRVMPAGGGADADLVTSSDDVYKLNVTSGVATLAAIPAADTKIFSPTLSSDSSTLYYTDSAGRLNMIRL